MTAHSADAGNAAVVTASVGAPISGVWIGHAGVTFQAITSSSRTGHANWQPNASTDDARAELFALLGSARWHFEPGGRVVMRPGDPAWSPYTLGGTLIRAGHQWNIALAPVQAPPGTQLSAQGQLVPRTDGGLDVHLTWTEESTEPGPDGSSRQTTAELHTVLWAGIRDADQRSFYVLGGSGVQISGEQIVDGRDDGQARVRVSGVLAGGWWELDPSGGFSYRPDASAQAPGRDPWLAVHEIVGTYSPTPAGFALQGKGTADLGPAGRITVDLAGALTLAGGSVGVFSGQIDYLDPRLGTPDKPGHLRAVVAQTVRVHQVGAVGPSGVQVSVGHVTATVHGPSGSHTVQVNVPTWTAPDQQSVIADLRAPDSVRKQKGAKLAYRHYRNDAQVVAVVRAQLQAGYLTKRPDGHFLDAMAWHTKTLGVHAAPADLALLRIVKKKAGVRKLRRWAKRSLAGR